jgi:hypothetical protein
VGGDAMTDHAYITFQKSETATMARGWPGQI